MNALPREWACDIYSRAAAVGQRRTLDSGQQRAVITAAIERGYGTTKPADDG
jgi:L-fuculose-phosphate aldolase